MELTALLLGFAGSIHCLGMCSPLVMAVTGGKGSFANKFIYNAGRIVTYGIMGALIAAAGVAISFLKFQNVISIAIGIALILAGLSGSRLLHVPGITPMMARVTLKLKLFFQRFLSNKTKRSIFALGAINGLLPCGLTFAALAISLSLKGPLDGFLFMIYFGAGTLPVMLGLTFFLQTWLLKIKWNAQAFTSVMLVLSGLLLIIRIFIPHFHELHSMTEVVEIVMCR